MPVAGVIRRLRYLQWRVFTAAILVDDSAVSDHQEFLLLRNDVFAISEVNCSRKQDEFR